MVQTVLDRFELVAPYGEDGILRRWLARNVRQADDEPVLVSVTGFPAGVASSDRVRQLAQYEANLVSQLVHPGISRTYEYGVDHECIFFATDLPIGESFASIWEKALMYDERIPVSLAVLLMHEVAEVLHHAHTQRASDGLTLTAVHAGLSPDRLFLQPDGSVLVTDFGISKILRRVNDLTEGQASEIANAYRAPEQVQGKTVGPSTDVFLMGAILWEMLSMQRLYPEELAQRDIAIVADDPEPPSNYNAAVTGTLDNVVLRALAKQPSERFPTAEDFADALRSFRDAMPLHGTVQDYLEEHFVDRQGAWRELQRTLAENDLHGALVAAKGSIV